MSEPLEDMVARFVETEGLVPAGSRILLAVSGGADSMAMLHIMHRLCADGRLKAELFVGHVNHNLRGQASDGDEAFVLGESQRLGLKAASVSVDVRGHAASMKLSIETAARHLRHQALARMAADFGCTVIATAHHKDDNAETIIHRMLRGTAYRGLAGIWPAKQFSSGIICIHPMLGVSRSDLREYLKLRSLSWREDASNENIEHTRNLIRHRLLPHMAAQSVGPLTDELSVLAGACRRYFANIALAADGVWATAARSRGPQGVVLDRAAFNNCPTAIQGELIQRCLLDIGCGEQAITAIHYAAIIAMAAAPESGSEISLPGAATALFTHDAIEFVPARQLQPGPASPCELPVPGSISFGPWRLVARLLPRTAGDIEDFRKKKTQFVEWFDMAAISGPILVRTRAEGDRFVPFGSTREQKVGKFLTAARIGGSERERTVIVADRNRVIWVAPVRSCEHTRVKDSTATIVEISLQPAIPDGE